MSNAMTTWWQFIGLTLGAFFTFGVYSFLYRENRISRICEHIFLGTFGALSIATTWEQMLMPKWWIPMLNGFQGLAAGRHVWSSIGHIVIGLLAIMLGACWYFIFSRKHLWLARLVMGIVMGATAGLAFKLIFEAQMPQITQSVTRSLYAVPKDPRTGLYAFSLTQTINNIVFVAILLSVMVYFFFSFEQKNIAVRGMSRFGRWCLMITFGTYFGNTVMARMSLFIERFQFVTEKWAIPGMHFLTHLH
jgi:hypothetical protein